MKNGNEERDEPEKGSNLYTSIDINIQSYAQQLAQKTLEQKQAKKKAKDIELEEQLAQSIAKIVENETEDAQVYVKQMQGNLDKKNAESKNKTDVLGVSQRSSDRQRTQPVQKSASTKKPVKKKKNNGGKIAD